MKFPLIALTGAFASAKASTSRHIKLGKTRQLRRGDATTEALLNKAVPYKKKKKNHRQLDADAAAADDYVAEEANVDVGESSTISFGKCIDIKTKSDDLFDESIVTQVQNGNALSLASFVLFNVCQDAYGYGCSEDNSDVYMIDLKTYFSVVGVKQASQRSDYCGQCQNNQDYWWVFVAHNSMMWYRVVAFLYHYYFILCEYVSNFAFTVLFSTSTWQWC